MSTTSKTSEDEEQQIFSTKSMYKLGGGDQHFLSFDFSILTNDIFQPFFNTLPNIIYKKCEHVLFSCKLEREFRNSGKVDLKRQETLKKSILFQRPTFMAYLVKILSKTLQSSKHLKILEFDSIHISTNLMIELFYGIGTNRSLEKISFRNVKTKDEDFQLLLKLISPYQFKSVSFVNCSLTSNSFQAIKEFIEQTPRNTSQYIRVLEEFNVDDNSFTVDELNAIEELVAKARNDAKTMPHELPDEDNTSYKIIDNRVIRAEERMSIMNPNNIGDDDSDIIIEAESSDSDDAYKSQSERQTYISQTCSYKSLPSKPKPKAVMPIQLSKIPTEDEFSSKDIFDLPTVAYPARHFRHLQREQEELARSRELLNLDIRALPDPNEMDEANIKRQNDLLRSILEVYIQKYNAVQFSDDVFLIGEGAEELAEVVREMNGQIEELKKVEKEEKEIRNNLSMSSRH